MRPEFQNNLNAIDSQYQPMTQQKAVFEKHPIMGAILGGLVAGPAGALTVPFGAKKTGNARRLAAYEAWQNATKNAYDQENIYRQLDESSGQGDLVNTALTNQGIQSPIAKGSYTSTQAMDAALKGGTAQDSYAQIRGDQSNDFAGIMGPALGQIPTAPPPPGQMGQPQLDTTRPFTASAQMQGEAPERPLRPFTYMDPDLVKQAITNQTDLQKTALGQAPDYAKLHAEVTKLVAEGKVEEARQLLITAQTKTEQKRPALIQAQTQFENERYRGGPAPQQPTTASERHAMYQAGAYGTPGSPEAIKAYSQALNNDAMGYSTETTYTRDGEGRVVTSNSRRVPTTFGSPDAGVGKAPTARPMSSAGISWLQNNGFAPPPGR